MERALVELARDGDEEAFASLIRMAGDRLMAVAFRILRDTDRAEDAVQQAIVAAWRDLPTLRDPDRFDGWLYRVLVNACYVEARRSRRWNANVRVLSPDTADRAAPVGTVKSRLHYATSALRAAIEADARAPGVAREGERLA